MAHMTPSERAAELLLIVRRIRRQTGLDVVPMLVVEGAADEDLLGGLCRHGRQQVFAAGNRDLVEQLLRHIRTNPVDGCVCLYLVDCDGYGKTIDLREESSLVVSETCDMEADLVRLGAALRVTRRFMPSEADAKGLLDRACQLAMSLSIVRRAAHRASTSMRRGNSQFRMADFSDLQFAAWVDAPPSAMQALDAVSRELNWDEEQRAQVQTVIAQVPEDFGRTCMGKDVLDTLFRMLRQEGVGEVRGWSLAYFYRSLAGELSLEDLETWEVGRRFKAWEKSQGLSLTGVEA